jgi:hypothetical protein
MNTMPGSYGPSFSIRNRCGVSSFKTTPRKSPRLTKEERKRFFRPIQTCLGKQVASTKRTPGAVGIGLSPRFGTITGFSVGKR